MEQVDVHIKSDPYLTPNNKINSKLLDLNVSTKTIKLLEENVGRNLCDLVLGKIFLDMTPQTKENKIKNELNFIRNKICCSTKYMLKKVKEKPWNERPASIIGVASTLYKK